MKINTKSLTFRTLFLFFISSVLFIFFITFTASYSFSKGYTSLIHEDISSIESAISPSIALNLSYGFNDALTDILKNQLKNKKILLLKIDSESLEKEMLYSNIDKSIQELKKKNHFISTRKLTDPATSKDLGNLTLVYSNASHITYMKNFYIYFSFGIFLFIVAMSLIGYFLYNSLKHLNTLALSFKKFNPNKPINFIFNTKTDDEIGIITKSANLMVEKLAKYISYNKELNLAISQNESHLREAQKIAKVGSWEYSIADEVLHLSDEIYRILRVRSDTKINWSDFLSLISKDDYRETIRILDDAIKNGSKFDLKYSLTLSNDNKIYVQTKGRVSKKNNAQAKMTAVTMDISQEIRDKKTIEKLAYYDALTGLANRTLLRDRMNKALQNSKREKSNLAVMFLDLDHFKLINDTLGHSVGDDLLIYISNILRKYIRESDTLSRLGGDEFILLFSSINSAIDAQNIAKKIQKALQEKHTIGVHELYVTSSIGIALYPKHAQNSEELIRNADTAMYEAKHAGRNGYKMYSDSMGNYVDKQLHLEQDLIQAVKNRDEIEVFYQAKIDATSNFISGAEALVRWRHPTKGLIFPDDFIFIAESTGLMIELGNIIIQESIFQLQEWNKLGLSGLKIAINLSPRQFQDSNLVSFAASMIDKYEVNPAQVEFEITETLSMTNMTNTLRILQELNTIGVSIAIDDFGTGHSSLSYLKKFPINTLKIDKSFIIDIVRNEEDKIIVETIVSMAHSLGFITVAEGVESLEHVQMLKNMGCNQLQGYHFSRPIPKDEFIKFLQNYLPN